MALISALIVLTAQFCEGQLIAGLVSASLLATKKITEKVKDVQQEREEAFKDERWDKTSDEDSPVYTTTRPRTARSFSATATQLTESQFEALQERIKDIMSSSTSDIGMGVVRARSPPSVAGDVKSYSPEVLSYMSQADRPDSSYRSYTNAPSPSYHSTNRLQSTSMDLSQRYSNYFNYGLLGTQ
eukprot:GHVH01000020.1.p1 GENE.GHVH01000020.1~~GHVH01000020.1.p1  ORF type:complete len:185 (+),score=22.13 GHVH01000020.1:211-765(+)